MRYACVVVALSLSLSLSPACKKKEPTPSNGSKSAAPVVTAAPAPPVAPPAASPAPPVAAPAASYKPRYAQRMFEVTMRMHLLARAVDQGNWGYANQQAVELYETFKQDLPAVLPANGVTPGIDLKAMRGGYTEGQLRPFLEATQKRDRGAFDKLFAEAIAGCNACHGAVGKGFVVIKANPKATHFTELIDVAAGAAQK